MALRLSDGLRNHLRSSEDLKNALDLGYLFIFTGSQPATANTAASLGNLLCRITKDGDDATGLTWEDGASVGQLQKTAAHVWEGTATADGVAGWFRYIEVTTDIATTQTAALAASTTSKRFDGVIASSGSELNTGNTTVKTGAKQTISDLSLTFPASA